MKNGLLIWNVVLTLVAGYLLISHFSTKNGTPSGRKIGKEDTLTASKDFSHCLF
jgi:hypothetical protein